MENLDLLIDLHRDGARQGPGSASDTRLAVTLAGLGEASGLQIADIGCGTGAAALELAQTLDANVTAVDLHPAFLEVLDERAQRDGVADRITKVAASMDALSFDDASFHAIFSEGAIYNMGFAEGIRAWRRLLKPGGILALSELTWFTAVRPASLTQYWQEQYPEVGAASAKLAELEAAGYAPIGYFALSKRSWLDTYLGPLQQRFGAFLERHGHSEAARDVVIEEQAEIALYERYADYFGYGYFIARRADD